MSDDLARGADRLLAALCRVPPGIVQRDTPFVASANPDLLNTAAEAIERLTTELSDERAAHAATAGSAEATALEVEDVIEGLNAELAERTRERDAARLELCEAMAKAASPGPGNPGSQAIAASIAEQRGWGYLYPEEPDLVKIRAAADAGAWLERAQLAAARYIDENKVTVDDAALAPRGV